MRVAAYGEALWDRLSSGEVLGGAPLNFAYRVQSLGHEARMISCLGRDELGDRALARIRELGLDASLIQRSCEHPTGTVDVHEDQEGNPSYTIKSPAAYDHIRMTEDLRRAAEAADCLCYGTLIQRDPDSRRTLYDLLEAAEKGTALCDLNLRPDCYTEQTIRWSIERCDILKLNEDELEHISPMYGLQGDVPGRVQRLIEDEGLAACVVTLGPAGAYAASARGHRAYCPAFAVPRVNTTGAGDAFTAAFVMELLGGRNLARACRYGNALGSLVTGQAGGTQPVERSEVERLLELNQFERVDERLSEFLAS